ncbi:hydroxyisourate hydrolase [Kroppenstedtia eburnea]
MTGKLTTHVLDLYHGRPAKEMQIELWYKDPGGSRNPIRRVQTNDDGRVDRPLLAENEMKPGVYELVFDVAAYFLAQKVELTTPPFLDRVPIRFGIGCRSGLGSITLTPTITFPCWSLLGHTALTVAVSLREHEKSDSLPPEG